MLSKEASAMFSKNPFIPARETMIAMCEATAMTVPETAFADHSERNGTRGSRARKSVMTNNAKMMNTAKKNGHT